METSENRFNSPKETTRIESFSDGVFAIAITLLILDMHVPEVKGNESLFTAVFAQWPAILALLIGFFTILICWINHHYMFQLIHFSNGPLLLLNGCKLLVVTITPFATALLAKHINTPQQPAAVNIFCFNFALMGTAMTAVWCYAVAHGFVRAPKKVLQATTRLYIFASIFSTTIWLVSFFSIIGSIILLCIMFLIFIFPKNTVNFLIGKAAEKTKMHSQVD